MKYNILFLSIFLTFFASIASAGALVPGSKSVTTAGTKVQLSATSTKVYWLDIQAKCDNTNYIYVGDSGLNNTIGIQLTPCSVLTISSGNTGKDPLNLTDIYIDSLVNGDGVRLNYWSYP